MDSQSMRLNPDAGADALPDVPRAFGRQWALSRPLPWNGTNLATGDILYHEGSTADRLFVLKSGIVKVISYLPNGRVRIMGLHGPGAVLGLVTPVSDATTYTHTAVAVNDVQAVWAPSAQLRRIRSQCAEEYLELVERHCEELNRAKRWITEFSADTITCRIARVIKYLSELQHKPSRDQVELLTCQEMAEMIGVSTESASRVLASFKRSGVLTPAHADQNGRNYRFDADLIDDIAYT